MNRHGESEKIENWQPRPNPIKGIKQGQWCCLEPIDAAKHGLSLFSAYQMDTEQRLWRYLPFGPFSEIEEFMDFVRSLEDREDAQFYAIIDKKNQAAVGFLAYLRINPSAGSIEIGALCYSPLLQRTRASTEATYLLLEHCFELGYRRCEWKCNALNGASKKSAKRFGFIYEGTFRQADVVKGANRDTDWFSIIDKDWFSLKRAFLQWLSSNNFDASGQQKCSLQDLISTHQSVNS